MKAEVHHRALTLMPPPVDDVGPTNLGHFSGPQDVPMHPPYATLSLDVSYENIYYCIDFKALERAAAVTVVSSPAGDRRVWRAEQSCAKNQLFQGQWTIFGQETRLPLLCCCF